ncbi:MAG: phosphotriesterase [Bryobacteraceae bacterium]
MKTAHSEITRRDVVHAIAAGGAALLPTALIGEVAFQRKAVIRTILKDVAPEELAGGATLFHEHLSFSTQFAAKLATTPFPGARGGPARGPGGPKPGEKYFMEDLDLMTDELAAAKKDGVACLVDGGHADMGRNLQFLEQLSQRSGMPIVASTGYYGQPFYTPELIAMSEDEIAKELIRQARETPVGAFGEIGTWNEAMTPDERKVFRAVGKAQQATNLGIFTHTAFGKGAVEQLDTLESVGVKPDRIAIGHLGGLLDPKVEVHKEICKRGAFVGFDRQGGGGDAAQVPLVMALVEAGHTNNLLFASDFSIAARLKHNGGPGYAQVVTVFALKLREAGMKEETLHQILVDNPRRFLAFVPKHARGKV